MEHVAGIDTAFDESVARGIEVGDAEVHAMEGPGSHLGVLHDRDSAGRAWRCHLHHAKVLAGAVVDEKIESDLIAVESLGAIHVRDGNDHQFKRPVHDESPCCDRLDRRPSATCNAGPRQNSSVVR